MSICLSLIIKVSFTRLCSCKYCGSWTHIYDALVGEDSYIPSVDAFPELAHGLWLLDRCYACFRSHGFSSSHTRLIRSVYGIYRSLLRGPFQLLSIPSSFLDMHVARRWIKKCPKQCDAVLSSRPNTFPELLSAAHANKNWDAQDRMY